MRWDQPIPLLLFKMRNGLGLFFARRGYFFIPLTDPKAYAARMMQQGIFTRAARTVRACQPEILFLKHHKQSQRNINERERS